MSDNQAELDELADLLELGPLGDLFIDLFAGNTAAVGGDEGLAIRRPEEVDDDALWWEDQLFGHLIGTNRPLGVYPLKEDGTVKWGCVDFDEGYKESWPDALNLHNVLLHGFDITSWIERSRSKGWHVWVFAEEWVNASTMRDALWAACEIAGAPTKEVNPKQTELKDGGLGNYVRLPYWSGPYTEYHRTSRQCFILADDPVPMAYNVEYALDEAHESRTPTEALEMLAKRRQQHDRTTTGDVAPQVPSTLDPKLVKKMDGLSFTIFTEGPGGGTEGDRSATLWNLALCLWDSGRFTKEQAWSVMIDADMRWGKYQAEDRMGVLWTSFDKAWGGR